MSKAMTKEERRNAAIVTGIALAKKHGVDNVSMSMVAKAHKITGPRLFHVFGTHAKFIAAVKRQAAKDKVVFPIKKVVPAAKKPKKVVPAAKAVDKGVVKSKAASMLTKAKKESTVLKKMAKANAKAVTSALKKMAKPKKVVAPPPPKKFAPLPAPAAPLINNLPESAALVE